MEAAHPLALPRALPRALGAVFGLTLALAIGGGLAGLAIFRTSPPAVPAALVDLPVLRFAERLGQRQGDSLRSPLTSGGGGCARSPEEPGVGIVGGNLAARADARLLEGEPYKVVWVVRGAEPPEAITLRVERIDEPGPEYELYLSRVKSDSKLPAGWLSFVDYPSELVFPEAGCWRVTLLEGTGEDAVFFQVLPPLTSR